MGVRLITEVNCFSNITKKIIVFVLTDIMEKALKLKPFKLN